MPADTFAPATPLPCYSRAMRWLIYTLAALQAGALGLAALSTHVTLADQMSRGMAFGMILAAGLCLSVFLGPALLLARSETRQHFGMACALAPLAVLAGLSIYLN